MSSDLTPEFPPATTRRSLHRRALGMLRTRSFWAMADQGVASASNFITLMTLGRFLPEAELGKFSLLWETMLYLNALHAALVIYPMTVRGAKLDPDRLRYLTTLCVIMGAVLYLPGGPLMFAFGAWQSIMLGIVAATAIGAFQLHETLRRSLMCHFRYTHVIWGDIVAYMGSSGVIVLLANKGMLTVPAVFACMTGSFLLASLVQAFWIRPGRAELREVQPNAAEFWVLGRWMLLSNATTVFTGLGVQWCLAAGQGLADVGKFQAIANLLRLTNPMVAAMGGLIVPAVAASTTMAGVRHAAMKYSLLGLTLLAPYFLLLAMFPQFGARLFYGANTAYGQYVLEIRLAVATAAAGYATAMFGAVLAGLGNSKAGFYSQVVNTVVSVLFVIPAALFLSWTATIVAGLCAMICTGLTALWLLRHHRDHPPAFEVGPPNRESPQ